MDTFFDFAEVSSYLTFKISASEKGCTISSELQMLQTSSTSFWKSLTKFSDRNYNCNPSTAHIIFARR